MQQEHTGYGIQDTRLPAGRQHTGYSNGKTARAYRIQHSGTEIQQEHTGKIARAYRIRHTGIGNRNSIQVTT